MKIFPQNSGFKLRLNMLIAVMLVDALSKVIFKTLSYILQNSKFPLLFQKYHLRYEDIDINKNLLFSFVKPIQNQHNAP